MKLTANDRAALSQAILSHVDGEITFVKSYPHSERMGEWAARIRTGQETSGDIFALARLASLPYTHPIIDDENTPEDDAKAAAFLLAIVKANGGDIPPAEHPRDALAYILHYIP